MGNRIFILAVMLVTVWLTQAWAGPLPPVVDKVAVTEKAVAVTFEGVDSAADLDELLRLCREQGIKGTFFISGRLLAGLPIKKVLEAGHEMGNCGMGREYWGEWSDEAIAQELREGEKVLQAVAGVTPRVVRPAYNYYGDNFGRAVLRLSPAPVVVRGVDTGDWTLDSPEAVREMLRQAVGSGDIINVNIKVKQAVAALPGAIGDLKRQGFELVTVTELRGKGPLPATKPQPSWGAAAMAVINSVTTARPYVALTFDDGGPAWRVAEILDVLKTHDIKSTFFLLGNWVAANPELVSRMAAEGHEIANHSYSHPRFSLLGPEEMRAEIQAARAAIRDVTGHSGAPFFRPPYGVYNADLTGVLKDLGYRALVLWSVDPRDWSGCGPEAVARQACAGAGAGAVILFHLHGADTPEALRQLIPMFKARGYVMTTLGRMTRDGELE